jgi:hypothetical protein
MFIRTLVKLYYVNLLLDCASWDQQELVDRDSALGGAQLS